MNLWLTAFAQKEGNLWYFGSQGNNAGLNFNVKPAAVLEDGKVKGENSEPFVMADPCGNLLFYSDGKKLWNREHQPMKNWVNTTNTDGFVQALVAVPYPGKDSLYYVFYMHQSTYNPDMPSVQLRYGLLDMSLDNGKGAIVQQDIPLYKTNTASLTAVKQANGLNFWILTVEHLTNRFLAYQVSEQGLQKTPVVTELPDLLFGNAKLRASPDGKKVAQYSFQRFILNFDNQTGKVSSWIVFPESFALGGYMDFSPDSQILYWGGAGANVNQGVILQFQLNQRTPEEIIASRYVIPATVNRPFTDFHLAPDGKIYVATQGTILDAIVNPNAVGSQLQYQQKVYSLPAFTLPNNIAGFVLGKQKNFLASPVCAGSLVQFRPQVNYRVRQWFWDFGDPASGMTDTASLESPSHVFSAAGTFNVRLITLSRCNEYDTITKTITLYPDPKIAFPQDTVTVCYNQVPVSLAVPRFPATSYQWSTDDTTLAINTSQTGWYTVTASNPCTTRRDSVFLRVNLEAVAYLPNDTIFCEGNFKVLDARNEGASYHWNTGETTRTIRIEQPGDYWVEVRGACNTVIDSANIIFVKEDISAFVPNVFTPNGDGQNDTFKHYVLNTPNYRLFIYNRWGEEVFHSDDPFESWNGRINGQESTAGTYFYLIHATDCRGNPVSFKGPVSLIR